MVFLFKLLFIAQGAFAAWPDGPWLNEKPMTSATVYAVAFGSPLDSQYIKVLDVWKNLQKKYRSFGVNFLAIVRPENAFPFSDNLVNLFLKDGHYDFPTFLDSGGSYSKQWRAYVTPTVILVLKDGKVINFDPGNFDPAAYEKSLQKVLKENDFSKLPVKEYTQDVDRHNCPNSQTYFLGKKQSSAWAHDPVVIGSTWAQKDNWIESSATEASVITVTTKTAMSVVASSDSSQILLKITVNDQKSSLVTIRYLKNYEIVSATEALAGKEMKVTVSTNSKKLRLWAIQTLPACRSFN